MKQQLGSVEKSKSKKRKRIDEAATEGLSDLKSSLEQAGMGTEHALNTLKKVVKNTGDVVVNTFDNQKQHHLLVLYSSSNRLQIANNS
jgi:hypothetical protein